MPERMVADGLFEVLDGSAVLIGGKCAQCGAVAFPRPSGCAKCTSDQIGDHRLPTEGALWTFTVQSFPPKEPYDGPQEPFGVGYVDLGGEVLVEGRLTESDAAALQIGMAMRSVPQVYTRDADGTDVVTFAFEPAGS